MGTENEIRQIYKAPLTLGSTTSRIKGKVQRSIKLIDFDVVINIHVLAFLLHAVFLAYIARPDPIKMALESSPFVVLQLCFLCAKKIHHRVVTGKKTLLPLLKFVQSKLEEELFSRPEIKPLTKEEEEKEEKMLIMFLLIFTTMLGITLTILQPTENVGMKIFWTIFWVMGDLFIWLIRKLSLATDDLRTGRLTLAISASIMATQLWFTFVIKFLSLKWTIVCSVFTFTTSLPMWFHLYSKGYFDEHV